MATLNPMYTPTKLSDIFSRTALVHTLIIFITVILKTCNCIYSHAMIISCWRSSWVELSWRGSLMMKVMKIFEMDNSSLFWLFLVLHQRTQRHSSYWQKACLVDIAADSCFSWPALPWLCSSSYAVRTFVFYCRKNHLVNNSMTDRQHTD